MLGGNQKAKRLWASRFTLVVFLAYIATCKSSLESRTLTKLNQRHYERSVDYAIFTRGGASDEDEGLLEDEEARDESDEVKDDNDNGLQSSSDIVGTMMGISKRLVVMLGKATLATTLALSRALQAGFRGSDIEEENDDDGNKEATFMVRVVRVLQRMWKAALNPRDASEDGLTEAVSRKSTPKKSGATSSTNIEQESFSDFGTYLAASYGVSITDQEESAAPVMGGTIGDALREARSKARLLVAFIPAARPGRDKKVTPDQVAIRSLLSSDVAQITEKRARKTEESGSFVLWSAKASSAEAVTAMKRLKAKQPNGKGDKRPLLLVAYPAQVLDSSGVPKLVPRLLAQHHCSPPPSPESMAAWLNALRKRHAKQYAAMHHELKEAKLFRERTEGYKSSVQSDVQRQENERKVEEERIAKENAEKERLEALSKRREELLASLALEPGNNVANVMTFALRFADGRTGQRRFTPETTLSSVFNWVDAMYGMEREMVVLTTMNGQKTFEWDGSEGLTLADTGLGKMTGLRVSEKKSAEDASNEAKPQ